MWRENLDGERIFVIHDFLSAETCQELIDKSEALAYETFTVEGEAVGYRNNARVVHDNAELADTLWMRARDFLPPAIERHRASGFNPRCRFYRYRGNESFAGHYDGSVRIGNLQSKLTFMVYLSDVAQGGETRFYEPGSGVLCEVRPECGKALVFDHLVLHEGVAVAEGVKYVLRTDVMYGEPAR